jgi:hypothetical protein
MRSVKALDGNGDDVFEKVEVWTLNSSKDECDSNDEDFTHCTAILLNIMNWSLRLYKIFFS